MRHANALSEIFKQNCIICHAQRRGVRQRRLVNTGACFCVCSINWVFNDAVLFVLSHVKKSRTVAFDLDAEFRSLVIKVMEVVIVQLCAEEGVSVH